MEELGLDNILNEDEVLDLFGTDNDDKQQEEIKENKIEKENNEETTEVIDENELFSDEPEGVGSEENNQDRKDTAQNNSSPSNQNNFFSSIATALVEEGIFPDLDDETLNNVKTPEDFKKIVEQQIQAGLDEKQKRIDEALNNGVQPSEIQQYEGVLDYLDKIDDEKLSEESEQSEQLRKNLIYQDFINRGYSKERASKMTDKSIETGNDVEDAKDALESNKEFYSNKYKTLLDDAKKNEEKLVNERKKQSEDLKKSIMEDKYLYGDVDVDKNTRKKIFENMSKPVYRDSNGNYLTEIQKYQIEHTADAVKNFAICYTLTNGFKDWNKLGNKQAKREVKRGLAKLENVINSTQRDSNGSLNFVGFDENSYLGKGVKLDI